MRRGNGGFFGFGLVFLFEQFEGFGAADVFAVHVERVFYAVGGKGVGKQIGCACEVVIGGGELVVFDGIVQREAEGVVAECAVAAGEVSADDVLRGFALQQGGVGLGLLDEVFGDSDGDLRLAGFGHLPCVGVAGGYV